MSRGIINTHDQLVAAGGGVAITRATSGGRDSFFAGWHVYRIVNGRAVKTDPDSAWYDGGMKSFVAIERDRGKAALARAIAWVAAQGWYKGDWKRNRQQDYVPAPIQRDFPIPKRGDN